MNDDENSYERQINIRNICRNIQRRREKLITNKNSGTRLNFKYFKRMRIIFMNNIVIN